MTNPATDPEEAERAVLDRLGEGGTDATAMAVVSNIYRAATAIRNLAEREVLSGHGLSWAGFTTLFVLWVWGPMGAGRLASEVGVSRPTATGLVSTLAARGLVERSTPAGDRRKTTVSLTREGLATIEQVFPEFHALEARVVAPLAGERRSQVADSLRTIIRGLA